MTKDEGLVVITGASRGIGRALTDHYVQAGFRVIGVARSVDDMEADPLIEWMAANLSRPEEVCDLAGRIIDLAKSADREIDVVINNAGVQYAMDIAAGAGADPKRIATEIAINLTAPIILATLLVDHMARPCGTIVNVTSLVSLQPKPSAPVYSATKAGLASFTRSLRKQFSGKGIRIVEALPPLVDTDMTRGRGRGKLTAEEMARAIFDGVEKRRRVVAPGLSRRVIALNRLVPELVARILARS